MCSGGPRLRAWEDFVLYAIGGRPCNFVRMAKPVLQPGERAWPRHAGLQAVIREKAGV